jgi:hypothetical protein
MNWRWENWRYHGDISFVRQFTHGIPSFFHSKTAGGWMFTAMIEFDSYSYENGR